MRTNLPVTGVERHLEEGQYILSKSDLRGNVTYVNRTLLDITGFSEEEVMGQPHNMLRHPDMPTEAFRDFWATLKSGKAWSGLVKNRCKNGDHYWVMANASPIWQNGTVVGYMSVRSRPDRRMVDAAEQLYREMRNNETNNALSEGRVMQGGWRGKLQKLGEITIRKRLMLILGGTLSLWLLISWLGLSAISKSAGDMDDIVNQRMAAGKLVGDIGTYYAVDIIDAVNKANAGRMSSESALASVEQAQQRISAAWEQLQGLKHSAAATKTLREADGLMRNASVDIDRLKRRLAAGGVAGQLGEFDGPLYARVDPISDKFTVLLELKRKTAQEDYAAAIGAQQQQRITIMTLTLLGALAIGFLLMRTYKIITDPLARMRKQMQEITSGNYALMVTKERADEIGDVSDTFKAMFIKLRFEMADSQRAADEANRFKFALDNVATPVTVSNEDNNLIYMNKAGRRQLETVFKSPATVDRMYGHPIVESVDDPSIGAIIRGRAERSMQAEGKAGDRIIRLTTTPVVDDRGVYLGRVCQWLDRTEEVGVESEVSNLVDAAADGNFSSRIRVEGKEGFFKSLAVGLNQLVEAVDNGLADVVRVLNALAQGDLSQTIDRDYQGTLAQMKTDANATVAQLKTIVTTIVESTDAINSAAKEIASGNADLSRRTESQAASLEETASSTEELTNTVKNNADNASRAMQLARTSREVADRGGRMVSEVVETMSAIQESSSKIAEIINVIDGIAFQTNILALNAAVEAARAGEQGRGFAVVAGEVRNLAQRSASAAKEIKELISESVTKVSNGYKLVETAGETMQEIVTSTQDVSQIMGEISSASEEQRNGIMQLNQAISSMDETTQQNAALVEEAAAAAQSLEDQAMSLTQAVGVFSLDGRGSRNVSNVERMPLRATGTDGPARLRAVSRPKPRVAKADDEWEEF